jgi:Uma2 family endonuclease
VIKINSRRRCRGTPDLIVEILSPSSSKRDLEDKLALYEKALVKEYWIVESSE